MEQLRHFIMGIGQALEAFGTAPAYRYPRPGDRVRDLSMIGGDMRAVAKDMQKSASTALTRANGKDHHRANQR